MRNDKRTALGNAVQCHHKDQQVGKSHPKWIRWPPSIACIILFQFMLFAILPCKFSLKTHGHKSMDKTKRKTQ
jgi:hypothetical protein